MTRTILVRAFVVVSMVLATHAYLQSAQRDAAAAMVRPLESIPLVIGGWRGIDEPAFDAETLRILGADDYLNRVYVDRNGVTAGLYVAFYASQKTGESIHSPLHCLPGNGWRPVATSRVTLPARGKSILVNRMLVQKAAMRQLVLYWFEGRGRSIASEYENKLWLVWDGFRRRRTEGALVRVMTPVGADEITADRTAVTFAQQAFVRLREVLQ
jgi:EpsI family protein